MKHLEDILNFGHNKDENIIYKIYIKEGKIEFIFSNTYIVSGMKEIPKEGNELSFFLSNIDETYSNSYKELFLDLNNIHLKTIQYKLNSSKKIFLDRFKLLNDNEILVYSKNITEQKKSEEKFLKEEQRLKAILNNTIQFYFFLDINYKILYMNPKAKEFFSNALDHNLFEGYSLNEYLPITDLEKFTSCFEHTFKGNIIKYETSMVYSDKTHGWFEFTFLPVKDKNKITSVCLGILDINERKNNIDRLNQLNQDLIEFNKHLEYRVQERTLELSEEIKIRKITEERLILSLEKEKELNEMKTRFISIVSHEFRTPMTVISASSQLLEAYGEKYTIEDKKKHFFRINESIKSLTNLMESVLKANKSEKQMLNIHKEFFNLKVFTDQIISNFESINPDFVFKRDFIISEDFQINTDKNIYKHILENLLSNAIKYSTQSNKVEVFLREKDHLYIELIVKDYGIGIPEEEQKNITQSFFRASNVSKINGSGVGLNLVKNFTEILEGDFSFKSIQNFGSEFCIKLLK